MKKLCLFLIIFLYCMSGCSTSSSVEKYRDFYYSGKTSNCLIENKVDACTELVNKSIQSKEFENLPVKPENSRDAFYLGMVNDCLAKHNETACSSLIDEAMKNQYFEQLGTPPTFPAPSK